MILVIHNNNKVLKVQDLNNGYELDFSNSKPAFVLFELAENYKDSILIWCHVNQEKNLNIDGLQTSFHLKNMMMSFSQNQYMLPQIGYVEDSPFLNVNKHVKYPTWLMSSCVGAIHASVLVMFKNEVDLNNSFDYALNSIAKLGIGKGLFCYSEPNLLKKPNQDCSEIKSSVADLFKFVKQHYRSRWIPILLLNFFWHEKQIPFLSFLKSYLFRQKKLENNFEIQSLKKSFPRDNHSIDVIIPTIGRKECIYDVLKDLSVQTVVPNKVIVVEQNPKPDSTTDLDFIKNENWPYIIVHKFIHQTGACNARNLALKEVDADYVFLADDDIRFDKNLISKIFNVFNEFNLEAITMSCLKKGEVEHIEQPIQWSVFGSGASVINSKYLNKVTFNKALEFGYGEDVDFGMQLRNQGADVIFCPDIQILHLNAPIGGFRTKFTHPWESDAIKPKPSPTVMLNRKTNTTNHQLLGYKITLFIKYYKDQNIRNPIKYYKTFRKQWQQSVFWANKLKEENS